MRKSWAVMWAVYLSSVVVVINQFKVPPVMKALMQDLQVDLGTAGWLMSLFALAGILLALPAAFLLNKFGPKHSGLMGLACNILGCVLGALAPSVTVLLVGRIIEGVGLALIAVVAPAAVAMWFEPEEVGLPMGIWSTWVPVGSSIAYNIATPLQAAYGWRGIWWVGAFLGLLAFIVHALVVTCPKPKELDVPRRQTTSTLLCAQVFQDPGIWLLAFTFFAFMFSAVGYTTWAPIYYHEAFGINPATANFYTSLLYIANVVGALICGWVLVRVPNRRLVLMTAVIASTVLYPWGFSLKSASLIVPYMLARGFISVFIATTIFTLASETLPLPEASGSIMGILSIGQNLGMLVGPPVIGQTVKYGGKWAAGNYPVLLGMLLATLATLLFAHLEKNVRLKARSQA